MLPLALSLSAVRAATRLAMVFERLWPLVLPAFLFAMLFAAISWFGLFRLVPDTIRVAGVSVFAIAIIGALTRLRHFRWPEDKSVDRRLEKNNRLVHAPVSSQTDNLSTGAGEFSQVLWLEHKRRMARDLKNLEPDLPRTGVPARDPFATRGAIVLLAVIAFAYSASPTGGRLTDAFHVHDVASSVPPRIDAWATPPVYTSRAPIFLTSKGNQTRELFTVPAGSVVTVRVSGGAGDETLSFTDSNGAITAIETATEQKRSESGSPVLTAKQFEYQLARDGNISVASRSGAIDSWQFTIVLDAPPKIRFNGEPKRAVSGALQLSYIAEDDYGIAEAHAAIDQPEESVSPDTRPLYGPPEMPLSLPRRGARITESRTLRDLTEHPWAGSAVSIQLDAIDDAGQSGKSEKKTLVLPARIFTNPLAKAVIEQRRELALDANSKPWVMTLMDAITIRPEDTIPNKAHFLALTSARTRLELAETDDELRAVVDYLWEVARGIEDGDLSAAEKRLRDAQEALKQALEDGASDAEIEQLMAELREAMQDFMRELAKRALENPELAQPMTPNGQELRQSDLDRLMDQIEELAKSGARDKAQELLSQLENMMNNLQAGRHMQDRSDGQRGQMREQMNKLGEMMQRQQELMNETFRNQQRRPGTDRGQREQQQGQTPGDQQGQGGMSADEFAEALRQLQEGQGQLRGELGEFLKDLEGMGIDPGNEFGQAGESMGRAGDALGRADSGEAIGEQEQALDALRRGAQGMMEQMQQAMQGENGGSEDDGTLNRRANRDPLGRPRATNGPDFGSGVEVPDEIDVQRARRILEAIRKRLGDNLAPRLEKEYLERLLQAR